ncbi:MAG: CDP-diacylglycerol--glycerol-3-phosphate 3-phosphatidyltransferase [Chloroflexaceae bacterium]|nr:CDP-diacylglycerol--glycerol-3-phosphate 3-phosphatidyltransferase [Chloroflexaceae bacterium]
MLRALPNMLGLFRILATPLLMWLILVGQPETYRWAVVLFLSMAVSDMLDGAIARRLDAVSPLGIFLDTISDKISVVGVLLPMIERDLLSGWVVLVIIMREFVVSGLRSFAAAEGQIIAAGIWGKQKHVITVVALVWRLLAAGVRPDLATPAGETTLYGFMVSLWPIPMTMAVVWTVFSAADYVWKAWPLLCQKWRPVPSQASDE